MTKNLVSLVVLGAWLTLAGPAWADSSSSKGDSNSNNNNSDSNKSNYQQKKVPWYKKYNPWGKKGPYGRYSKLPYKKNTPSTKLSLSDKNPRYDHWSKKKSKKNRNATLHYKKKSRLRIQRGKKLKKRWFLSRFFKNLKRRFMSIKLPFFKDSRARMNNRDIAASRSNPFGNSGGFGKNVHRGGRLVRDRWQFKKGKLPKRPRRARVRRNVRVRRFR